MQEYPPNPNGQQPPQPFPGYPQYPQPPQVWPQHGQFSSSPQPPRACLDADTIKHYWARPKARALMVCAAALILVCMCGSIMTAAANAGASANATTMQQQQNQQQSSATHTPVKPTATANPNASWKDYANMVSTNATTLGKDSDAMSTACSASDVPSCRAAVRTFDDDVQLFQADLDLHPAPACFKTVDTYLRTALHLYDQGATEVLQGIDQYKASMITKGDNDILTGTKSLNKATAAIQTAHCV